jgi:hypothetical protein
LRRASRHDRLGHYLGGQRLMMMPEDATFRSVRPLSHSNHEFSQVFRTCVNSSSQSVENG